MPTELQQNAAASNSGTQQVGAMQQPAEAEQQQTQQLTQAQQDHEDRQNLLDKMEFGKEVTQLNGEMSSSQTSTTSSTSLNGSISNGSGRKSSLISPDPTPYVTKARVTRPTPPPPSYNPMQFVQIKPCNLYQTAQQQLKKAEEVKKIKEIKKEEPEDWQNNLDNWKSSRRKRVEHIIDRVVEVKKLELEEHDRSRRKSKTFSEMIEERGERGGARGLTKLASLAVYNEDESNDFSDLGIGTSSASGKSSLSEDYDNHSVTSENAELDKAIFENKQKQNSVAREYISSPGYDTSSSTAPASSPDPCEYTYEGAIQDYKQRVSRATNNAAITANSYKFDQHKTHTTQVNATAATTTTKTTTAKSPSADGYKNGQNDSYPVRRGSKIEDRLSGFEVTSPSDTQENAENKKVDVPKIDITKRKEIFEQQQQLQKQNSEAKPLTNGGSNGIPKVTLRDRFKFDANAGNETQQQQAAKKEVKRLSGDITSIKERLQSLEQQKNALANGSSAASGSEVTISNKPSVDVPVASLKDRLSSLQNAVAKEEVRKPPVALIDARQLEIMKSEEEKLIKQQQQQQQPQEHIVEPTIQLSDESKPTMEPVDRDDSGIHTADDIDTEVDAMPTATLVTEQAAAEPQPQMQNEQLSAAIAALALEEQQLEQAANAVNQIEAEFAELITAPPTAAVAQQKRELPQQPPTQPQPNAPTATATATATATFNNLDFSEINEALDSAKEATFTQTNHANTNSNEQSQHDQQKDQNDTDTFHSDNIEHKQLTTNEFELKMNALNSCDINKQQLNANMDDTKITNGQQEANHMTQQQQEQEQESEILIANEPIYENITKAHANGNAENIPNNFELNYANQNDNKNNFNDFNNHNILNNNNKRLTQNHNNNAQQQLALAEHQPNAVQGETNAYNNTITALTITTTTTASNEQQTQQVQQVQQITEQHMSMFVQQSQQQQQETQASYYSTNNDNNNNNNNNNNSNNNNSSSKHAHQSSNTAADIEPYYQVPKSSEPYYDAPKHLRPIPVYENIDIFYNGLENSTLTTTALGATNDGFMNLQPPKEKPPPPPIESPPLFDDVDSIDSKTDMTWSSSENTYETIHAANKQQQHSNLEQPEHNVANSPPIKRMNSTKRIKKELRHKRSSFLGIEDSYDNDESYLELTVAPPPDMAQLLQEERRLEKQLYLKAGLCDSSDTGESRDSGVSENHSRQSSEHYTNLSNENVNQLEALPPISATNDMLYHNEAHMRMVAQTPLLQTVKGNSAESWTESATAAAAASKSLTEAQATANAKMLSIEEKIREQEEVLRVERELLQFSQEELKRQRENLLLRENMARRELQHGAKMLMSANRHSLQDLKALEASLGSVGATAAMHTMSNGYQSAFVPQQQQQHHTNAILRPQHIYANIPNLQQQYYQQADLDYRKSMSDLNEFSKRLTLPQAPQPPHHQPPLPPIPPTKPMRAMHVATSNGHAHAHFTNGMPANAAHIDDYSTRQRHSLTALNPNAYGGSLVKIANTQATNTTNTSANAAIMRTHNTIANYQHTQSAQNLSQLPQLTNGGQHVIHHGNMTRNTLHALSATPKPKYTDDWVQVQTRKTFENPKLANDPAWLSAYQQKRKSMPDAYTHGYNNHWMVQEAEQRRLIEQQKQQLQLSRRSIPNGKTILPANMNSNNSNNTANGSNNNGKPLPDAIIQTLTERVQSKGLGERKRFDNACNSSNNSSPAHTAMPATYPHLQQHQQQQYLKQQQPLPGVAAPHQRHTSYNKNNAIITTPTTATMTTATTTTTNNNITQDKVLSVSGKKKCSHCGEELGRGAAMIIESLLLFYHINCFKCCVCHVQLGDGLNGTDVRVRNHKLHCQNCYSSDDGIKFSCV